MDYDGVVYAAKVYWTTGYNKALVDVIAEGRTHKKCAYYPEEDHFYTVIRVKGKNIKVLFNLP